MMEIQQIMKAENLIVLVSLRVGIVQEVIILKMISEMDNEEMDLSEEVKNEKMR